MLEVPSIANSQARVDGVIIVASGEVKEEGGSSLHYRASP